MKKLNKKGFTLVELLAVIVILALLMVVATRTVGDSLNKSKKAAMRTEIQKVLSRTVEECRTSEIDGTTPSYTYSSGSKEGDYTFTYTISSCKITAFCITDGKNKMVNNAKATINTNGASITFASDHDWAEGATCS